MEIYPLVEKDLGDHKGHPMCINRRKSPSPSVGAGAGMMRGGGLYGRPRSPPLRPSLAPPTATLVQGVRRATIKAHPTHPNHPRPYGSLGLLPVSVASPSPRLMLIGRPLRPANRLLSARARKFPFLPTAASGWTSTTPQAAEAEFAFLPDYQQHTGIEDRRVGTTKDTDQQREREVADGYATKERQRTQCDQYGQRCVERAGHGLYQAGVDYLLKCLRGAALHVLTDTVEHNDCIVHRETDHRQQRGDEQRVDLDMKSPAQD